MRRRIVRMGCAAAIAAAFLSVAAPVSAATYIEGYTHRRSYVAGDSIEFHVSTAAPTYSIEIVRDGLPPQSVATYPNITGVYHAQPVVRPWEGALWPVSTTLVVPPTWVTGSYYAKLIAPDSSFQMCPFVIRHPTPGTRSRIVFCMEYNTRQAYNYWGGKSLYVPDNSPATVVSFLRPHFPENGLGKGSWVPPNCYGRLELEGFPLEYIDEYDVDRFPGILNNYDVIVVSAHLEYNSRTFMDALEAHIDRGAHFATFGGNDLWWQIRYEDDGDTLVGYKQRAFAQDPLYGVNNELVTTNWYHPLLNRPSESIMGMAFDDWCEDLEGADYTVRMASHWLFEGTGVVDGQVIGHDLADGETDWVMRDSPPIVDLVMAAERTVPRPGITPHYNPSHAAACFYQRSPEYGFPNGRGGMVFAAGCQGLCNAMLDGQPDNLILRRLLRNLFNRFVSTPPPPIPGDFDGDRQVGPGDVPAFVGAMLAPAPTVVQLQTGDFNHDGRLNGADVQAFVRRLP